MKGCRSCNYWGAVEEFLDRDDPAAVGQKVQLGHCRRAAPLVMMLEVKADEEPPRMQSCWPLCASDDWCGEWTPNYV